MDIKIASPSSRFHFSSLTWFCGILVQVKKKKTQAGCHILSSLLGLLHYFYLAFAYPHSHIVSSPLGLLQYFYFVFAYPHSTTTIHLTHVMFNVLYGFTYCVCYLFNLMSIIYFFFSIPLLLC